MRKMVVIFCLMALGLATQALAADPMKIGVVDMGKVFKASDAGKAAFSDLEEKFKPMQGDLEKQKHELDKLRDELQKQGVALSADAKTEKEKDFQKKFRDYQDLLQTSQRTMKAEEDRLAKPILEQLVKILKDFGKKNGYSLIIEKNAGLLYADEKADVTAQIISELNKAMPKK